MVVDLIPEVVATVLSGAKVVTLGVIAALSGSLGSIATVVISKRLNRSTTEVKNALDWRTFYSEHMDLMDKIHKEEMETSKRLHKQEIEEIKKLHKKNLEDIKSVMKKEINVLVEKMDVMKKDYDNQAREAKIWEDDSMKKSDIIKQKDLVISKQEVELERLRK